MFKRLVPKPLGAQRLASLPLRSSRRQFRHGRHSADRRQQRLSYHEARAANLTIRVVAPHLEIKLAEAEHPVHRAASLLPSDRWCEAALILKLMIDTTMV